MAPDWRRAVERLRLGPERSDDPVILMYHRVATPAHDPWALAVSPANFQAQIEALSRRRTVVPLAWLASELGAGRRPRGVAVVTFDDAYFDVLSHGAPVLDRFAAPATIFVPTALLGRPGEFWWDALTRLLLGSGKLPSTLSTASNVWRVDERAEPLKTLLAIWAGLRGLDVAEREAAMADLARQLPDAPVPDKNDRPMTADEVAQLSSSGLVSMGAHTLTHPSLPMLDAEHIEREVAGSAAAVREITGKPAVGFAYPFGDHDQRCIASVRAAGLKHAVTTAHGRARSASNLLALPRVAVENWDAPTFVRRALGEAA